MTASTELRRNAGWIAGGIAALVLLYLLAPILTPFVLGAGLAYLGDPIVDRLQKWKLSRTAGVCVVFVVIGGVGLLALLLIVPLLQKQIATFVQNVPAYLQWVQQTALPALGIPINDDLRLDAQSLKSVVADHWKEAGGLAKDLLARATASGGALITAVANLLMVPIVSFYLLRDWDDLVAWIEGMIPRDRVSQTRALAQETDQVLGAFIRGQLLVMAALAAIYTVGLSIAGLDLALLIGLGAGLVSFVPYLGFIVGILAAGLAMLVQTQELLPLVWVALVFGIGQVLESAVLTPLLVGDRIGLHPVAVIFAVMAGGQLFGFIGVLLALPAAAALAVLLRHTKRHWLQSSLYRGRSGGAAE